MTDTQHPFLATLLRATNAHDLDAVVACFHAGYSNQTPAHPGRDFRGRQQVRDNWRQIFGFVPDVRASVVRWAPDGSDVWSEWEMSGTRLDGTPHLMRGVILFGVSDGLATWARFYLEPVDDRDVPAGDAVRSQVHAGDVLSAGPA